jgi:hypothetical protein
LYRCGTHWNVGQGFKANGCSCVARKGS